MESLSDRERRSALTYYGLASIGTLVWWLWVGFFPAWRKCFFGAGFSTEYMAVLILPDALTVLGLSIFMLPSLIRRKQFAKWIAWTHFGAQGYGWTVAIGLAIIDPQAYWGVVLMTLSVGTALAFAIRLQDVSVFWGWFSFAASPDRTPSEHWKRALLQTAAMWSSFLIVIPGVLCLAESALRWSENWITFPPLRLIGISLFLAGGTVGLFAARMMATQGSGTPLPSEEARFLVVNGPYRFVRNPMAVSGIVQGLGVGIAVGSPLVVVYALLGGIWWNTLVRHAEEEHLLSSFGQAYEDYRGTTRCWFPRSRR